MYYDRLFQVRKCLRKTPLASEWQSHDVKPGLQPNSGAVSTIAGVSLGQGVQNLFLGNANS